MTNNSMRKYHCAGMHHQPAARTRHFLCINSHPLQAADRMSRHMGKAGMTGCTTARREAGPAIPPATKWPTATRPSRPRTLQDTPTVPQTWDSSLKNSSPPALPTRCMPSKKRPPGLAPVVISRRTQAVSLCGPPEAGQILSRWPYSLADS